MNAYSFKPASYLAAYFVTAIAFLALDFVWLGVLMKDFYVSQLGPMMLDSPNLIAAGVFYALYVIGIVVFGIKPGMEADSAKKCAIQSALFGLLAYATYDLSNLATLKGWSMALTIVDIAWGALVSTIAGMTGFVTMRAFERKAAA